MSSLFDPETPPEDGPGLDRFAGAPGGGAVAAAVTRGSENAQRTLPSATLAWSGSADFWKPNA
ncbi:MAG: hypothetical protein JSW71_04540 [Gemmatimonadota bacterium]|nr:MAG: hypothetical protein JSW71_04540 [Gemmatimonadota bacterium]